MNAFCKGLLLSVLLAQAGTAVGTTRYVNGVTGSDLDSCLAPSVACKTIGHAIAESAAGDTVMVAAATYTENLTLGISLEIIGAGSAHTVIDGGGAASVVDISNASAHVTLSGVTLTHGAAARDGGGIYNVGTLTLVSSSVTGNGATQTGGGIYNGGTVWLNNSTVSSNSAGLLAGGTDSGGGVANSGTMTIRNSTISGNTAVHPSEPFAAGFGGGIWNVGRLTITNSTISGNSAVGIDLRLGHPSQGGGISNAGTLIISSSTIAGNRGSLGGGIQGSATLHNVVIANNTGSPEFIGNCDGTMSSQGYNLSSDGSCDFRGPGDLNSTDPKLGTLGNYGGPTQTIPLLSGSPAIDTGNPGGCTDALGNRLTTDQRGMPRPDLEDKAGCDRGAYESQRD